MPALKELKDKEMQDLKELELLKLKVARELEEKRQEAEDLGLKTYCIENSLTWLRKI